MKNPFNFSTILGFGMFLLTVGYYIFAKPDNLSSDASFLADIIYWSFLTITNLLFGLTFYAINILRDKDY
jgi:hypothetical protein